MFCLIFSGFFFIVQATKIKKKYIHKIIVFKNGQNFTVVIKRNNRVFTG